MTVGDNIKNLACVTNKSLSSIARDSGINRSQISRCTNNQISVNLTTFLKIAKAHPNFVWDFGDVKVVITK